MASFSSKSNNRSISLPSRSHPVTRRIEEELNKLKTWEFSAAPTAEAVYSGLIGFGEVHKCMCDLLNLPSTLQALSQCQNKKWVDEILDKSVRFLDICGTTKELVSQFKENVKDVQSLLRRRKGDLSITSYTLFRKKMTKDVKNLVTALKKMGHEEMVVATEVDQLVSAVIRMLREVTIIGISVFQMVLVYLSAPISKPVSKWSLVSRLVNKGGVVQDDVNEIESADVALSSLSKCGPNNEVEKIQFVQSKLETVEAHFQCIENGLDNIFRCLVRSRSTLLNVVSCQ